jgi:hypothetical protein
MFVLKNKKIKFLVRSKLKCAANAYYEYFIYFLWLWSPARAMAYSFTRFRDDTKRRTTVGRNPLDEWSTRRKDLYLTGGI